MCAQAVMQHSVPSNTLADVLERVLDKGLVIAGDIKIKLVDIELLTIQLRLVICSVDKAREIGLDWWAPALPQVLPHPPQPNVALGPQQPSRPLADGSERSGPTPVPRRSLYSEVMKRAAHSAASR